MADVIDTLVDTLSQVFSSKERVVVSEAPGAGPESEEAGHRLVAEAVNGGRLPLGYLANNPGKGRSALGYGGHGDPVVLDEHTDVEVARALSETLRIARSARPRDVPTRGKIKENHWQWMETHNTQTMGAVSGPFSLFDGTLAAPSAGNSVQTIAVSLPAGTVSPIFYLDRYPYAQYVNIFLRSFSLMPLGTTTTGNQEFWFSDPGGATAGLGQGFANAGQPYQNINSQMATPLTDPGLLQLGTITVNNIGIGGTPVQMRWQLTVGYLLGYPDPWFNEQWIIPPTPRELAEGMRSIEG